MQEIKVTYTGDRLPFTIDVLKEYLGIDYQNKDGVLQVIGKSAVDQIERITGLALVAQTVTWTFDLDGEYARRLPRMPYISMVHVKGVDQDGTKTTLTTSDYYLRGDTLKTIEVFGEYEQYEVEFRAGYTKETVPATLVEAIFKQIKFNAENTTGGQLSQEVLNYIQPFVVYG